MLCCQGTPESAHCALIFMTVHLFCLHYCKVLRLGAQGGLDKNRNKMDHSLIHPHIFFLSDWLLLLLTVVVNNSSLDEVTQE